MTTKLIYLVLSQTGTILSRIIRALTKDRYNHSSIGLDDGLDEMYSFGRKNPYNPFIGGFVRESKNFGTFKRFKKTDVLVLGLPVTEEVHNTIKQELLTMQKNRKNYHYNYLGLFLAFFHRARKKENCYYCSEFVASFLQKYGLARTGNDDVVRPNSLRFLVDGTPLYEGKLTDYSAAVSAELVTPDAAATDTETAR